MKSSFSAAIPASSASSAIFSTKAMTSSLPGLAFDFRGEPFGSTPDLALLAEDRCMWMTSYCTKCGMRAAFPQRLIDGAPAPYDSPQIHVGGDEPTSPAAKNTSSCPVARCPATTTSSAASGRNPGDLVAGSFYFFTISFDQSRFSPGLRSCD